MKNLRQFICEALKRDIVAWLQEVYDTMQKLIENNKLEPLDVDVKQLNKLISDDLKKKYPKTYRKGKMISALGLIRRSKRTLNVDRFRL